MSIVPVTKVVILAPSVNKDVVLRRLQEAGCLHVEAMNRRAASTTDEGSPAMRPETRRVLAFLLASPLRRHSETADAAFDPLAVERRAIQIEDRLRQLDEATRSLQYRLRTLEPWGHYELDDRLLARGLRLWLYAVPHYLLHRIPNHVIAWEVVARDHLVSYVAVVHPHEPEGMPAERAHTGSVALHEQQRRLQALQAEQDDLQAERVALTRWSQALAASLVRLENEAACHQVAQLAQDDDGLLSISAWVPEAALFLLRDLADEARFALVRCLSDADEVPPTLLHNQGVREAGQALLGIFMVPSYHAWDPSSWLLAAFALFFGMVVADAGYALTAGILLLLAWPWRKGAR